MDLPHRPPPVDLPPPSSLFSDSEGDSNPTSPEVSHIAPPKPLSSLPAAAPPVAKFRSPSTSAPPQKAPTTASTALVMKPVVPASVSVSADASEWTDLRFPPEVESPSAAVAPSAAAEASSRRTVVVDLRQSIQKALQDAAAAEASSRREGGVNLKSHGDDDDDDDDDAWNTHRKLIKQGSMSVRVSKEAVKKVIRQGALK